MGVPPLTLPCEPLQTGLWVLACFVSMHVLHTYCVPRTVMPSKKAS